MLTSVGWREEVEGRKEGGCPAKRDWRNDMKVETRATLSGNLGDLETSDGRRGSRREQAGLRVKHVW